MRKSEKRENRKETEKEKIQRSSGSRPMKADTNCSSVTIATEDKLFGEHPHQPKMVRPNISKRTLSTDQVSAMSRVSLIKECKGLRKQVLELEHRLSRETSYSRTETKRAEDISREYEKSMGQLEKQKFLKEMYINRGKETTLELGRLMKYSDPETLSTARIATQVRDNLKWKKKKDLIADYETLKVAHTTSGNKFEAELQAEMEKNKRLQEELDRIAVSNNGRFEAHVDTVSQQIETLQFEFQREAEQKKALLKHYEELQALYTSNQHDLEKEKKAHEGTVSNGWQVINTLRAEQDALRQEMAKGISTLQQNALEKETAFERELEDLRSQLNAQIALNLELSSELEAEQEYRPPRKRAWREEKNEVTINPPAIEQLQKAEDSIPNEPASSSLTEMSEEVPPKKTPSVWKRTRHFLGLRKPQSWKK